MYKNETLFILLMRCIRTHDLSEDDIDWYSDVIGSKIGLQSTVYFIIITDMSNDIGAYCISFNRKVDMTIKRRDRDCLLRLISNTLDNLNVIYANPFLTREQVLCVDREITMRHSSYMFVIENYDWSIPVEDCIETSYKMSCSVNGRIPFPFVHVDMTRMMIDGVPTEIDKIILLESIVDNENNLDETMRRHVEDNYSIEIAMLRHHKIFD